MRYIAMTYNEDLSTQINRKQAVLMVRKRSRKFSKRCKSNKQN